MARLPRLAVCVAAVTCLVLLGSCVASAASAASAEHALDAMPIDEPQMRDVEYVDNMAKAMGLVEIDSDADAESETETEAEAEVETETAADAEAEAEVEAEPALLQVRIEEPLNFVMDEEDAHHHVMVEAYSESGMSTMKPPKAAKKAPAPPKVQNFAGEPVNQKELLPVRTAPAPGEKPLEDTFRTAPVSSPKREAADVVNRRIEHAKHHLRKLAHQEHKAAREDYLEKLHKFEYARSIDKARQSRKFERALPPNAPVMPHPSSNAATFNGDRNHNTLFPAATAKSDGKAPSQDYDFQHRGDGDSYAEHTNLVEHGAQVDSQAEAQAESQAEAAAETAAEAQLTAANQALAQAQAEVDAATEAEAASEAEFRAHMEQEQQAEADAEGDEAAETDDSAATEEEAAVTDDATPVTGAEKAAAADEAKKSADEAAGAPLIVKDPCSEQCDPVGGWRTAECQDCIVRGMVNGWIVKSIVDKQAGYNYIHYSRNKCVAYANELRLRSSEVKGAPFAHCFFQKIHETCNL